MLINAQRPEELRLAIVTGKTLENYKVEFAESGLTRGNIYRGVIANIQPSLNAAFIDYGAERQGFLAIQDVVPEAYYKSPSSSHPRIEEVLAKGKPIVVQVTKDAMGTKGAAITTSLSLAGRYIVLTPFEDTRGVSRKVEDDDTRRKLKQIAASFELPEGCGVIVRTAALEQTKATLNRDLAALLRLWKRVQNAASGGKGTHLLYTDQDLILQSLRDYLDASIEEVLIDDSEAFQKAEAYMRAFMPRSKTRLTFYSERLPLFTKYGLEVQIDRIYERRVELPSGGSIVIDATEALTAIDVNSGRSTKAATQEETAVNTNIEAANEVARQLRLRDLGGIVVVDFIDMRASKNQRRVEKEMKEALKSDKARSTVGRISSNGLVEINRQRIQQALQLRTHRTCPTCNGVGRLASEEMVSVSLLRRIEARAATGAVQGVKVCLHPELADSFQNHYRKELASLEAEFDLEIEVIAAPGLHRPDEQVEWYKRERPMPVARTRPAPPTLQVWDLALGEDELEDEEEEEGAEAGGAAAKEGRSDPASSADPNGKRKRRRRGGRNKNRKAGEGAAEGDEPGAPRHLDDGADPLSAHPLHARDGEDDDEDGPAGEKDEEDGPAVEGEDTESAEARRRKRRGGRRKKRASPAAGAAGAASAPGTARPAERAPAPQRPVFTIDPDLGPLSASLRPYEEPEDDGADHGSDGADAFDDFEGPDDAEGPSDADGQSAGNGAPESAAAMARRKRRRGGRRRRRPGAKDEAPAGADAATPGDGGAVEATPPAAPSPTLDDLE
jgi:ribonuclease E